MRLDHVSYVASHDQISDVVQRIGSQIGTAFVDGGIHPQFGTRNFTAPLLNGQYIEVVCALDHPAAEKTPFGQAVTKKAAEGGGWLTWVFATEELAEIEKEIGRSAIEGHRRLPNGTDLKWKQVGVKSLLTDPALPFFIEWITGEHPSQTGKPSAAIREIVFSNSNPLESTAFKSQVGGALKSNGINCSVKPNPGESGIENIVFQTPFQLIEVN
jgi:Glyoxalase-like domain